MGETWTIDEAFFMNGEPDVIERIKRLGFWPRSVPIEIEPLAGGITNRNYVIGAGGRKYVARLASDQRRLGIDRRNEILCQRAASALGIAPEVLHDAEGVLISQFVKGQTLKAEEIQDARFIPRIAALLRTLHASREELTGEILYFSAFQTVRTYANTARQLGAALPNDLDRLLEDAKMLTRQVGPFVPALCHNDLLAANLLVDEERIWLVDWEYAGIGHPLFDLAGLASNNAFSEEQERSLISAYCGEFDSDQFRVFQILKTISLLREAFWSVIQTVASDISFDYRAYAESNFARYRESRRRLDGDS